MKQSQIGKGFSPNTYRLFISLSLAGILERETWHAIFGSGGVVIRRVQSVHLKFCFPRVRLVLIDAEYQDYAVEL
jgi:hypothetical protein